MSTYWAEWAWLGGDVALAGVTIGVEAGTIAAVEANTARPPNATPLGGLTLPGLANAHSHAFHRMLRGRTHAESGSFWTWRDLMYAEAARLDPDRYFAVARVAFAEMAQAGFTVVGEFHYLHRDAAGRPYADPNAMGEAVIAAAAEAGIRLTLLDTLYLHGGIDDDGGYRPLNETQARFGDENVAQWVERVDHLAEGERVRIGAAAHSVRAVDPDSLAMMADWAADRGVPVHAHVSEQPAENEQSRRAHGRTPTQVFGDAGLVTEDFTAVHATHLTDGDIELLGSAAASACLCPTTERDLADGLGASMSLTGAGVPLCVGTDSHTVIDPFEEIRGIEMHARLASGNRGNHPPEKLLEMGSAAGYRSLGWPTGGVIASGAPADLTVVDLDSVRLAGLGHDQVVPGVVFAAAAADVHAVIVGGEMVVRDGRHAGVDVSAELGRLSAPE